MLGLDDPVGLAFANYYLAIDDPAAGESRLMVALRAQHQLGHRMGMATTLEGLAWVAGSSGRLERAALLFGAGAALFEELGLMAIFPYWAVHHAACVAAARTSMGDGRYRSCWERGYAMSREQVVAAALEAAPPTNEHRLAAAAEDDTGELSPRELEVARHVASGLSNRGIAAELFVSVATVKTHVSHILTKLGLASRVELAPWIAAQDSVR